MIILFIFILWKMKNNIVSLLFDIGNAYIPFMRLFSTVNKKKTIKWQLGNSATMDCIYKIMCTKYAQ